MAKEFEPSKRDIHIQGQDKEIIIPGDSYVMDSDGEVLSLCEMCQFKPRTCPASEELWSVLVPMLPGEDSPRRYPFPNPPEEADIIWNPESISEEHGLKWEDGFEVGKWTEETLPPVYICAEFKPKNDFE